MMSKDIFSSSKSVIPIVDNIVLDDDPSIRLGVRFQEVFTFFGKGLRRVREL